MRISDWSSDVCSSDLGVIYCLRVLAHLHSIDSKSLWPDLRGTCPATVTSAAKLPPPRDNSGCLPIEEVDVELVEGIGVLELRPVATFIEDDILGAGDHRSEEHKSELQSLMRISNTVF